MFQVTFSAASAPDVIAAEAAKAVSPAISTNPSLRLIWAFPLVDTGESRRFFTPSLCSPTRGLSIGRPGGGGKRADALSQLPRIGNCHGASRGLKSTGL